MRTRSLLPVSLFVLTALYGCPRCEFDEACDGNVLMTCSIGVDQQVGSPAEARLACTGANPVCITVDERNALCAIAEARSCVPDTAPRCEGGSQITCVDGFEVARNCVAHGNVCGEVEGAFRCYAEPKVVCVQDFESICSGTRLTHCDAGLVTHEECGLDRPVQRCTAFENDYGKGAYCEG